MLARWLLATGLLGLAVAANAALLMRAPTPITPPTGEVKIDLAGLPLVVSRALIADHAQQAGGRLTRLDLQMDRVHYQPLAGSFMRKPGEAAPEVLHVVLTNPGPKAPPADQLQQIYARFLAPETAQASGGLMLRRFRAGTPYEDRELFIGAGALGGSIGRLFIALCPRGAAQDIEPCIARLRQDGVEAELRFPARALGEWRRMGTETLQIIRRLRGLDEG
ncbi:MAG: hypothetical protein MUF11_11605 [Beijerinckiaceae bacterium]|jgi:hypothetical protein|nr:hypothetical protein [Beijerinckiaceae bacterium]